MRSREPRARAVDPSPFDLSLITAFPSPFHGRTASGSSTGSPLSSATASPTSSPTSALRRVSRGPGAALSTTASRSDGDCYYDNSSRSRSQSPLTFGSVLRGRSSLLFLRRRPSAVELALSEERSRCDEDSIERQGLSLMEPRPVDPILAPMDLDAHIWDRGPSEQDKTVPATVSSSSSHTSSMASHLHQPRFVMGGIFEIMEGRA